MPTTTEIVEQLQREWTTFRTANDQRLLEIEKHGQASAETMAIVNKANEAITSIQATIAQASSRLEELENRANRPHAGGGNVRTMDEKQLRLYARWEGMVKFANRQIPAAEIDPAHVDLDFIRAYQKSFNNYLRYGERAPADSLRMLNELSSGSDPDGGYWVEPDTTGRIVGFVYDTSPIRKHATIETISSDSLEGTYDLDEAGASWVGETSSRTDTDTPEVGRWKIPVHEMYAQPRATQRLLDDAMVDVEGWLARKVSDKFGRTEATACVTGTGVLKPRGFTTYSAGTPAATSVAAYQVIKQVASLAAAGITADGLKNLVFEGIKKAYRNGAIFGMNRATEADVRILKDGSGNYLWTPDISQPGQGVLMGYPVEEFADMPDVAASAEPIVFGNLKEAYTIVDRLGIRVLRDPYTAKPYVRFYTTKRVGGDVLNFEAIALQTCSAS